MGSLEGVGLCGHREGGQAEGHDRDQLRDESGCCIGGYVVVPILQAAVYTSS